MLSEPSEARHKKQVKQSASFFPLSENNTEIIDRLRSPDNSWELPAVLREVSGIALMPDGTMACIQDEEGKIFVYDLAEKKITREIPFADPGDYEGISIANEDAYVLRSDGAIFEVAGFKNENPTVKSYKPSLPATINMEGMAYDDQNNRLLLAPKGYDPKLKGHKAIYAFSLDTKKLETDPIIKIPLLRLFPHQKSHNLILKYCSPLHLRLIL